VVYATKTCDVLGIGESISSVFCFVFKFKKQTTNVSLSERFQNTIDKSRKQAKSILLTHIIHIRSISLLDTDTSIKRGWSASLFDENNISAISWRSSLLVEETGWPGENNRPVASHLHILSHNALHLALIETRTHKRVVIGTGCLGSFKSNYHTIMAMTAGRMGDNVIGLVSEQKTGSTTRKVARSIMLD
jgi:hypothetical protein